MAQGFADLAPADFKLSSAAKSCSEYAQDVEGSIRVLNAEAQFFVRAVALEVILADEFRGVVVLCKPLGPKGVAGSASKPDALFL